MARGSQKSSDRDQEKEVPVWASMMMDQYATCADRIEKAILSSLSKFGEKIEEINSRQSEILSRLDALEKRLSSLQSSPSLMDQKLLYSTMVKVRADGEKIEEKLKRITWIGIGEQADERSTRRFDMEALREVIYSSDEQLIEELSKGNITAHRFPAIRPNNLNGRDRIIKIELPTQALGQATYSHEDWTSEPNKAIRAFICTS